MEQKTMFEQVLEHLQLNKGRLPFIAQETGVPYGTLKKIADGTTKNPGINHVENLYNYFVLPPTSTDSSQEAIA